jgi:hypothetical protein
MPRDLSQSATQLNNRPEAMLGPVARYLTWRTMQARAGPIQEGIPLYEDQQA